jgi:hypothetical protein
MAQSSLSRRQFLHISGAAVSALALAACAAPVAAPGAAPAAADAAPAVPEPARAGGDSIQNPMVGLSKSAILLASAPALVRSKNFQLLSRRVTHQT